MFVAVAERDNGLWPLGPGLFEDESDDDESSCGFPAVTVAAVAERVSGI